MKIFSCILILFAAAMLQADKSGTELQQITKETRKSDADKDGIEEVEITVYKRGQDRILVECIDKVHKGKNFRHYFVGNKIKIIESDYDGDGIYETMQVFGKDINDFEIFIKEGPTVRPLETAALQKLQELQKEHMDKFKEILYKQAKKIMETAPEN